MGTIQRVISVLPARRLVVLLVLTLATAGTLVSLDASPAAAANWRTVRTHCQTPAEGRVCGELQRDGNTSSYRYRVKVRADSGSWIRQSSWVQGQKSDGTDAFLEFCADDCPRVSGRSWTSSWVRVGSGTGYFHSSYQTSRRSFSLGTGRSAPYVEDRGSCSDTGRVCVSIYRRFVDDLGYWHGRAAADPAPGAWITPVRTTLKTTRPDKSAARTYSDGQQTSDWSGRSPEIGPTGQPSSVTVAFTYQTPNGTFTLTEAYTGAG